MTQEHLCAICQKRQWVRTQVCDPCRDRLPQTVTQIIELHAQLPEAYERGQGAGERVTGSRQAPLPVNLDAVDLSGEARQGSRAPFARGVLGLDEDQTGHLPVATTLDQWVRDWRDELAFAQSLPVPTVPELARWLTNRMEWACDRHPAIDEFASEMGRLRAVLRGVLGLTDAPPDFCDGVVCRKCDRYALYRESDYVECDHCGLLYTENEYREWVGLLAGQARRMAV